MVTRNSLHVDGVLGTLGAERFSIGLHYVLDNGDSIDGSADLATWAADCGDFFASSQSTPMMASLSTSGRITAIRAYAYEGNGPAVNTATSTLSVSGQGTIAHPPQITRCVSLLGNEIGATKRGRFYWPALVAAMDSATLKSGVPAGFTQSCADMIAWFRDAAPGGLQLVPVIYSRTANALTTVNTIRVGDVLDTQRRRRDALVEAYQQVGVPPPA